jgi:hypothetical protein
MNESLVRNVKLSISFSVSGLDDLHSRFNCVIQNYHPPLNFSILTAHTNDLDDAHGPIFGDRDLMIFYLNL